MSNNLTNPDTPNPPYYVATYKGRSAVIKRDADYQTTIKLVQKSIPNLRSADAQNIFISTALPDCGDELLLISEEIWPELVGQVKSVEVTLEDQPDDVDTPTVANPTARAPEAPVTTPTVSPGPVSIVVHTVARKSLKFVDLPVSKTIKDVKLLIEATAGIPAGIQLLDLSGKRLTNTATLEQSGLINSKSCNLELRTRQTMIYLFAPHDKGSPVLKNVEVKLSLDRAWELAALGIQAPHKSFTQSASWTVDVHEDGKLVDQSSQTELSCLFWDGISAASSVVVPQLVNQISPTRDSLRPLTTVEPSNSVVIPYFNLNSYISSVFKGAGFESGSVFLSWMKVWQRTSLTRHIAIRFLPQAKYETIAPLSVSQCSDLWMVRFVILFKGLSESAAALWDTYHPTYEQGPGIWNETIGVEGISFRSNRHKSFAFEVTCMEVY